MSSPIKGRGSTDRIAHRFERWQRLSDDWECDPQESQARPTPTQVTLQTARSAISRNDSPDIGFEQSINPYRGCEHGCSYCYARPYHSYLDGSPGLDFETRLVARANLPQVLQQELSRPTYRPSVLAIGTVTDAYQPIERQYRITRQILQIMLDTRHPCAVVTKGSAILDDLPLLSELASHRLLAVYVSLCTLQAELARVMEPRAASPLKRLDIMRRLSEAGVPVGVSVAPQIPFLNTDMEDCLEAAHQAGARRAFYSVLRLPHELSPLFRQWLQDHRPLAAQRIMARIADLRGGKDYDASWGQRKTGQGVWAQLLSQRFNLTCARLGMNQQPFECRSNAFTPPRLDGQAVLF